MNSDGTKIIRSRAFLISGEGIRGKRECEGGCGVIGIIGSRPLEGRFIIRPCSQMRNRGNGKGGGVAAVGIFPDRPEYYALHIGYLDEAVREKLEKKYIYGPFDVDFVEDQENINDYRDAGLEVQPPKVRRYFVRVKKTALKRFIGAHGFRDAAAAEDEFVYQNSFRINTQFYARSERPRAFVLSHGRNLMILKAVGYAEDIARYYKLENKKANVWIGHQRYPTRGRVWHPGGAHPFAGLHEALVHNGDFANYFSVTQYLRQKNIEPLFVTDTEVSVLLFDYYSRVLGYPLEYVIEALAPTPEGDFERLPKRLQRIYRAIQTAHLHGSPDGPWFFIIARADPNSGEPQLIGITDVSMLRPQVFSLQQGMDGFGAIASEKQAIDAFFGELAAEHPHIPAIADYYWNARGGSCTDGGAFVYTVRGGGASARLEVRDKFGTPLHQRCQAENGRSEARPMKRGGAEAADSVPELVHTLADDERETCMSLIEQLRCGATEKFRSVANKYAQGCGQEHWRSALRLFSLLRDRKWNYMDARPSFVLSNLDAAIDGVLDSLPAPDASTMDGDCRLEYASAAQWETSEPSRSGATLVVDCTGFPPEGENAVSRLLVRAHGMGWKKFILYRAHGDRFIGCGLGAGSREVRIDVYGSSGDYLGSGLDGASIYVHGNAQDQIGQIMKSGCLVIFGDVGQTFLYGAKGGEAYVLGNAAGRPLINAVGNIRAIINGTPLDYCAESFMAGDQLDGGFVIINGLAFNDRCMLIGMDLKYPGNNLFSLASGGACYLNDPYTTVDESQLNGATFVPFTQADWGNIYPYLMRNEALFGISVRNDILVVDGVLKWPKEVFRKIVASTETAELDWSSLTS